MSLAQRLKQLVALSFPNALLALQVDLVLVQLLQDMLAPLLVFLDSLLVQNVGNPVRWHLAKVVPESLLLQCASRRVFGDLAPPLLGSQVFKKCRLEQLQCLQFFLGPSELLICLHPQDIGFKLALLVPLQRFPSVQSVFAHQLLSLFLAFFPLHLTEVDW